MLVHVFIIDNTIRTILVKVLVMAEKKADFSSQNLKFLRTSAGWSRRDFIDELEKVGLQIHETTLRRLEDGSQKMKTEEAIAISTVFAMTLDDFVTKPVQEGRSLVMGRYRSYVARLMLARAELVLVQQALRELEQAFMEYVKTNPDIDFMPAKPMKDRREWEADLSRKTISGEMANVYEAVTFDGEWLSGIIEELEGRYGEG